VLVVPPGYVVSARRPLGIDVLLRKARHAPEAEGLTEGLHALPEPLGDADELEVLDLLVRKVAGGLVLHPLEIGELAQAEPLLVQRTAAVVPHTGRPEEVTVVGDKALNRMPDPRHEPAPRVQVVKCVRKEVPVDETRPLGHKVGPRLFPGEYHPVVEPDAGAADAAEYAPETRACALGYMDAYDHT